MIYSTKQIYSFTWLDITQNLETWIFTETSKCASANSKVQAFKQCLRTKLKEILEAIGELSLRLIKMNSQICHTGTGTGLRIL